VRFHAHRMTDAACPVRRLRPAWDVGWVRPGPVTMTASTCANCGSGLLQLEAWKEGCDGAMTLRLRCPECFVRIVGEFNAEQVARLDEALTEARLEMMALYQATVCEDIGEEAALMSRALALDLIGADDFASPTA
jgi:hypothetical protein